MADRTYVPGYGYVIKGEKGTGVTSQPGWQRPASWGSQPGSTSGSINGTQRGIASQPVPTTTTKPATSVNDRAANPVLPFPTAGQDPANTAYYNTLRIGRYGPPGGINGPLSQGTGQPGSALRELPKIFTAATVGDAKDAYWSDPISRSLIEQAAAVHYAGNPNFIPQWSENFWNDIVNASLTPGAKSPWETIEGILSGRISASPDESVSTSSGGGGGGYSSGGGGGGSTSQQVSLANPSEARGLLTQFMQASMGRNPNSREVSKFLELLQGYQKNNPTVVSADGNTVTQSGGVDPGMVAQQFVETLPDYTESQADRYYRTFMSALLGGAA